MNQHCVWPTHWKRISKKIRRSDIFVIKLVINKSWSTINFLIKSVERHPQQSTWTMRFKGMNEDGILMNDHELSIWKKDSWAANSSAENQIMDLMTTEFSVLFNSSEPFVTPTIICLETSNSKQPRFFFFNFVSNV